MGIRQWLKRKGLYLISAKDRIQVQAENRAGAGNAFSCEDDPHLRFRAAEDLSIELGKIANHNNLYKSDIIRACVKLSLPIIKEHPELLKKILERC